MKPVRPPAILFILLCLGYLLYLNQTLSLLPERVASHFDVGGQPNGWMTRSGYMTFMGIFGLGLPLFVVVLCFLSRFLPDWTFNLPHREFWLSPEQRSQTYEYLLARSLWLACPLVGFVGGTHYLTIQANCSVPVHLPSGPLLTLLAIFLAGVALWVVGLVRHFRNPA
jgi:hypothetical protein